MKKVSVVIPVYNGAAFLAEALGSIFNQTYSPYEVIVVDDGSTDSSRSIVEQFADNIVYVWQENRGPAFARNRGIERAQGEYIAFLDADDKWLSNKVERQIACFETNKTAAMVYTKMVNFRDSDGQELEILPPRVISGRIVDEILMKGLILLSTVMIKTEILRRIGGFDESLPTAEDTNLYIRIAKEYDVYGVDEVLVKRRRHIGNLSEKTDIVRGTLDSLEKIIVLYPDMHPRHYYPMRSAYLRRGKKMMMEYYRDQKYEMCLEICKRLMSVRRTDLKILVYYALSLLLTHRKRASPV